MSKSHGFILGVMCLSLVFLLSGGKVLAEANSASINEYVYLDPSFGTGGKILTQIDGKERNFANALVLQPDGKLVVAGFSSYVNSDADIALVRYNPDGSLDESFGSGGIVTTDFMGGFDQAYSLALQEDGKLVVAGCAWVMGQDIALVRYNPDGSLDLSFGDNNRLYGRGRTTTPIEYGACADGVVIQSDGKYVISGNDKGTLTPNTGVLVRFNQDGSLDTSFNGSGKVLFSGFHFGPIIVREDGKIITGGYSARAVVLRFKPDGSIDDSFMQSYVPQLEDVNALVMQPDNKLIAVGFGIGLGFSVARFNADGGLDESFGNGGITAVKIGPSGGWDIPYAVAIQPDGKILVAGASDTTVLRWPQGPRVMAVARFNPDGSLDTSFNVSGYATTQFNVELGNTYNGANEVVVQPDGKVVVSGIVDRTGISNVTIYQYGLARFMTQSLGYGLSVDSQLPNPGQLITYTLQLSNQGPLTLTNVRLTDELPSEVTLAGQIHLEPADAGVVGTLPELARGIDLDIGQVITISLPVRVDPELVSVATITNTVSMTSTEIPQPLTTSVIIQNNAAPIARDDFALVEKNTAARLFPLGNDSDPNGQILSLTEVGTPQHGAAVIDGSTVLYTPQADFMGKDEFTYIVSDGSLSAAATVTMDVLDKVWHTYLEFIPRSMR